jgi:hypothetical protein
MPAFHAKPDSASIFIFKGALPCKAGRPIDHDFKGGPRFGLKCTAHPAIGVITFIGLKERIL